MTNPYAAPEITPELAQEQRKRPKMWRSLLVAYGVHHVASVLGLLTGVLFKPSELARFFPLDRPLETLRTLVFIPLIDLFVVLEPVLLSFAAPDLDTFWYWLRIPVIFIIPVAGFMYARSLRREWLWVVAVVSYGVFVSLILLWGFTLPEVVNEQQVRVVSQSHSHSRTLTLANTGTRIGPG